MTDRTFIVTEVIEYRVTATDADAAVSHVVMDGNRDGHCFVAVADRTAEEIEEEVTL